MTLKVQISDFVMGEGGSPDVTFTLVFREVPEEKAVVAECL
jgi:hypothetical protein